MATPTGSRAEAARQWYARERRRKKQDQKDFRIAGLVAAPHDFGSAAASVAFPNSLVLPADVVLLVRVASAVFPIPPAPQTIAPGDTLFDDGVNQARNAEAMEGFTRIRAVFRESRTLTITRGATLVTGSLEVYFWGPKGRRILIGTGTLT
jgi:hypothetical protein